MKTQKPIRPQLAENVALGGDCPQKLDPQVLENLANVSGQLRQDLIDAALAQLEWSQSLKDETRKY
jgi:hypothetical protein